MRTLAADDLDSHTRMFTPLKSVEFDESRYDWFVEVRMLRRVRVGIALENLIQQTNNTQTSISKQL